MPFANILIKWYLTHRRDLPWRDTTDAYQIWLSEIILQQTRVAQGMPYYLRFTNAFGDVHALASATEETVMRHWQGLGYYSRARNLHAAAKFISSNLNGKFPSDFDGLRKLKGIGDYTAAAIASFAYNEAVPVVDGNVMRVLSRYFAIEHDIAKPSAKKIFADIARELMPPRQAGTFNQAIMEFGALQCVPKRPDCAVCPLNGGCVALQKGMVGELPVKSKKAKPKDRYFHYLFVVDENRNISLRKRSGNDIWRNLFEFPMAETDAPSEAEQALVAAGIAGEILSVRFLPHLETVHKLTHQNLNIRFSEIRVREIRENGVTLQKIDDYALPAALVKFLDKHNK